AGVSGWYIKARLLTPVLFGTAASQGAGALLSLPRDRLRRHAPRGPHVHPRRLPARRTQPRRLAAARRIVAAEPKAQGRSGRDGAGHAPASRGRSVVTCPPAKQRPPAA